MDLIYSHKKKEKKIEYKNLCVKQYNSTQKDKIEKINDNYYFSYSNETKKANLIHYDKMNDSLIDIKESEITYKDDIFSISFSLDKTEIYACLSLKRIIKIYNCDLKNKKIIDTNYYISDTSYLFRFNKCIQILPEKIVTADDSSVCIWGKIEDYQIYSIIKNHEINSAIVDLLLVDNNYFICTQPFKDKIIFFNCKTLGKEKILSKIDCKNADNCLFLFNKYIIINCSKGLAIILIKTQELIQYVENNKHLSSFKELSFYNNEIIYILNKKMEKGNLYIDIVKLKMIDNILEIYERFQTIKFENEVKNNKFYLSCMNIEDILLFGKKFYIVKEDTQMCKILK